MSFWKKKSVVIKFISEVGVYDIKNKIVRKKKHASI